METNLLQLWLACTSNSLGPDGLGFESRCGRDLPSSVQTGPGGHLPPVKWVWVSFPLVKRQGRGINHHHHLAPELKKG
jgi:hypothetical protein